MLKSLTVQNYVLIQQLDIQFNNGFTIITGETGAGKSILLGALNLILGQRADTSVLKDKSKKCVIEASFDIADYQLNELFTENEIDYDATTIIRREIAENGKSRAFVNDTPANLSFLKLLGERLIDIHSQHENLILSNNIFQLQVVDAFAQQAEILFQYQKTYSLFRSLSSEYQLLRERATKEMSDFEYFQFQFKQLEEAKLIENEQAELELELQQLTHAEDIKTNLIKVSNFISGEGNSVLSLLKEGLHSLSQIKNFFSLAKELHERVNTCYYELKDIADETEKHSESIEYSPDRITFVNQRLDLLYSLQQKHRVATVNELLTLKTQFQQKLAEIGSFDEKLDELRQAIDKQKHLLVTDAATLTQNRLKTVEVIEKQIVVLLTQLGMPNAIFKVSITKTGDFTLFGCDKVNFLFSANKNSEIQDLTKVASGGEMSRVMLSIKTIISKSIALPTIIFDEIDAGVSGDIAARMGMIMQKMADNMQVINITHLPQIAAKGSKHFLVYKYDTLEGTFTNVKLLTQQERVQEIAKMLSGSELTDAAVENAKELLKK